MHLRLPGARALAPTKKRALSELPSQGDALAELAVLVLVPAICPLGRFQLALRALEQRLRLAGLRPSSGSAGGPN